ncbi:MAG TPA: c-type cytochrome domain-containing protein [Bryobacteraceae bacterium]
MTRTSIFKIAPMALLAMGFGVLRPARPQQQPAAQQIAQQMAQQIVSQRALLDQYCVGCHNQRLKIADLMLDKADPANPVADAELWEKVIRQLRAGTMPPQGIPRPPAAAVDRFVTFLEASLDEAGDKTGADAGGKAGGSEDTDALVILRQARAN